MTKFQNGLAKPERVGPSFGLNADPRPGSRAAQSARFWDRIAESYARRPIADEASYQRKLAITQSYLRPDMAVLEFGCGTGSTALAHAPCVNQIDAIDVSAKMIEIARRKAKVAQVTNVIFGEAAIEDLEADDATYDAVLGLSILHLLRDRNAAIAKVHRLLKPGGVFVSSTACIANMSVLMSVVLPIVGPIGRALGLLPLVQVFSVADLRAAMVQTGFVIESDWQPGKGKAVFIVARKEA
jgi:SAM-dependent methyltransferase